MINLDNFKVPTYTELEEKAQQNYVQLKFLLSKKECLDWKHCMYNVSLLHLHFAKVHFFTKF